MNEYGVSEESYTEVQEEKSVSAPLFLSQIPQQIFQSNLHIFIKNKDPCFDYKRVAIIRPEQGGKLRL